MIVEGKKKLDMKMKMLEFGSYAMIYICTSSNMKQRSVPGIALRPSNNEGEMCFMSLYTGQKLHTYEWTKLPVDEDEMERV